METIWNLELSLTAFLQNLVGWLELPMRMFTFLGNEEFYMLVMPALYWCVDAVLGLRIGVMLMASGTLNGIAKLVFRLPRPYWVDESVRAFISEKSFGLPSGHAMNATSVWGLLAASLRRKWATLVLVLLIFLVGVSRIYLGVHFVSDVLVGWLLGALLLWLFLHLEPQVSAWVKKTPLGRLLLLMFALSLLVIALSALLVYANRGLAIPAEWLQTAALTAPGSEINPLSLESTITNAAAFFGLVAGVAWVNAHGGFHAGGNIWLRLLRFVIGLTGVLVLWAGLGSFFPHGTDLLSYSLRYLRYALTGLWISAGAPLVFLRLGLAQSASAVAQKAD